MVLDVVALRFSANAAACVYWCVCELVMSACLWLSIVSAFRSVQILFSSLFFLNCNNCNRSGECVCIFSLYLCGDRPKNETKKNGKRKLKVSVYVYCRNTKPQKRRKRPHNNKEEELEDDKEENEEEEGATRARQMQHFFVFVFVTSFVVVVEKQPSAFCTLARSRSHIMLARSRFPVAPGRWCPI